MIRTRFSSCGSPALVVALCSCFCALAASGAGVEAKEAAPRGATLGHVTFPVTGGEAARRHFMRGLLALHSFWYEEARDEFREATRGEPDFAMGYWGEALTYFHPVWSEDDVAAERKALDAVPARPKVSARESDYLAAARALIGEGDFAGHAARYREAMRALHERYPDDDEAAALYAVAVLGTVDRRATDVRPQVEAGALMLELYARNPQHPGAAHYIIHAFDDPAHARIALPAARRYAQIAPEAFHALHMPSHIFVHLGMWDEAAASNEASWAASQAWVARKKLDASRSDFHSLSWLHAIYLELGQRRKADEVLARDRAALAAAREDRAWMRVDYLKMVLKDAVESDDFSRLDEELAPLGQPEPAATSAGKPAAASPATPSCHPVRETDDAKAARRERAYLALVRAEAALNRRDAVAAARATDELTATLTGDERRADLWRATELALRGRAAALRSDTAGALKQLAEAADLEDREAPSGPIERGVSARERLGEALLAAHRPAEALRELRRALDLHPRRARVLLGCARAGAAADDPTAAAYWADLAKVWAHADDDTRGLAEVRHALAGR
jgi:tetratricopeptide (TPR) repeat protein